MNFTHSASCRQYLIILRTYPVPIELPQKNKGFFGARRRTYTNNVTASLTGPISAAAVPPESANPKLIFSLIFFKNEKNSSNRVVCLLHGGIRANQNCIKALLTTIIYCENVVSHGRNEFVPQWPVFECPMRGLAMKK